MTTPQRSARLLGTALLGTIGAAAASSASASPAPTHTTATHRARRADPVERGRPLVRHRTAHPAGVAAATAVTRLLSSATRGTADAVAFDLTTSARRVAAASRTPGVPGGRSPAPGNASSTVPTGSAAAAPATGPAAATQTGSSTAGGGGAGGAASSGGAAGVSAGGGSAGGGSAAGGSVGTAGVGTAGSLGGNAGTAGGEPAAPAGFTSSQLVFNDTFSSGALDGSKWTNFMTSRAAGGSPWNAAGGGSSLGSTYLDYDLPSAVSVGPGGLDLHASAGSSQPGFGWTSGVVTTYGHFQFDGGYVQVRAKMPTANGNWPAIWMLPGPGANTSTDNFEIDLFEGGSTYPGAASGTYAFHVHMNNTTQWGSAVQTGVNLADGYHTYGLDWVPGQSITWYFDGRQVAQVTSAQFTIPNEPMELILNNGIANGSTSAWHTTVDGSTGSSSDMLVSSVQIYQ